MIRGIRLIGLGLLAGCALAEPPAAEDRPPLGSGTRRPVVLVPGVTGSMLRTPGGEVAFGGTRQFFLPRDGGHRLTRPLDSSLAAPFVAFDLIREIRIPLLLRKPIYQPIVDLLVDAGYRQGNIAHPSADASLYLFAYDWRQDNVESAALLSASLAAIRAATRNSRVDLVCQSNGAHVCRWAARFGALDLAAAEQGAQTPGAGIGRLILVGASNGGSLRILREMNRGRRYVPLIGRRFQPEIFFTFPSLFADLPSSSSADGLFLDVEGKVLDVALYDPESWQRFGWSIFARPAASRADRARPLFGTFDARRRFLATQLERATRFQALLAGESGDPDVVAYHLVENDGEPTPRRAVLVPDGRGWKTIFTGDRWLASRPRLAERTSSPGDGHSVLGSQRHLSAVETPRLAPPRRVTGGHFEMLLEPETQEYLREVLIAPLYPRLESKAKSPPSRKRNISTDSASGLSSIGR